MSYEEEFDNIMRQKAGEMDFPFEEAHWEKAQAMMPKGRSGGSELLKSLLWSGAVVVAGGLATILWFSEVKKPQVTKNNQLMAFAVAAETNDEAPGSAVAKDQTEPGASAPASEADLPVTTENRTDIEPASLKTGKSDKNSVSVAASKSSGRMQSLISGHAQAGESRHGSVQQGHPGQTGIVLTAPDQQFVQTNDVSDVLQSTKMLLDYHQGENDIRAGALTQIKDDDDYVPKKKHTRVFAEVSGGAAFWTGWQSEGSHDGRGINWFGGANIGLTFSGKWQLVSGVQVFNFGHLDAPFYSVRKMTYGFGSVANSTVITTREMRYIGVPLSIGYSFLGGSQIRAGIIGAQLWHATNTVETASLRDGETSESHSASNHKLYEGMNQQVFMITAGYGVRLTKKVNAGVEIVYGLTDLFSERTYLRRAERPLMIRAGLTFRFLEK